MADPTKCSLVGFLLAEVAMSDDGSVSRYVTGEVLSTREFVGWGLGESGATPVAFGERDMWLARWIASAYDLVLASSLARGYRIKPDVRSMPPLGTDMRRYIPFSYGTKSWIDSDGVWRMMYATPFPHRYDFRDVYYATYAMIPSAGEREVLDFSRTMRRENLYIGRAHADLIDNLPLDHSFADPVRSSYLVAYFTLCLPASTQHFHVITRELVRAKLDVVLARLRSLAVVAIESHVERRAPPTLAEVRSLLLPDAVFV